MDKMCGCEINVGLPPSLASEGIKRLETEEILNKCWRVQILNEEVMNLEKLQKQRQISQFKKWLVQLKQQ